jgi:hypothetical protein
MRKRSMPLIVDSYDYGFRLAKKKGEREMSGGKDTLKRGSHDI